MELSHGQSAAAETEFFGGEQWQQSEDKDITGSESWRDKYFLDHAELVGVLSRKDEVAAASKK